MKLYSRCWAVNAVKSAATAAYNTVIKPVATAVYNTVVKPIQTFVGNFNRQVARPATRWTQEHIVRPTQNRLRQAATSVYETIEGASYAAQQTWQAFKAEAQAYTQALVSKANQFVCTTADRIKEVDWKKVGKIALNVGGMILGGVAIATGVGAPLGVLLIGAGVADLTFMAADIQEEATGDNFLKDSVFKGNETAYLAAELGVGLLAPGPGGEVRAGVKIADEIISHGDEIVDAGKAIVKNSDEIADAGRKTDFYVTPSGDAVPATGYRYMDSKYTDQVLESGEFYGRSYIGFEKFDSASEARDAYQISSNWSDAGLRGEFDTLQIVDNLVVPTERGNRGSILEPITSYYKEYGEGGYHQLLVPDSTIKFDNIAVLDR